MSPVAEDIPVQSFTSIPIVDFAKLETDKPAFLKDLKHALGEVGFTYLKNVPGFDEASQEKLFKLAHQFYDQTDDQLKQSEENSHFFGWQPPKRAELSQEFHYGYDVEEYPQDDESIPIHRRVLFGRNVWPKNIPGFQEAFDEHLVTCDKLNRALHYAICESLGVPSNSLDKYVWGPNGERKGFASVRILHYTPLELATPERQAALTRSSDGSPLSLNEHRDFNPFLTLLIADAVGLEVMNLSGQWIPAPPIPGHVVINVGQALSDVTAGNLVATMHRVNAKTALKKRVSIPCFLGPDPDVEGGLQKIAGLKPKELTEEATRAIEISTSSSNRKKLWEQSNIGRRLLYQRRTNHPHTMVKYWPDLVKEIDAELGNVRIGD